MLESRIDDYFQAPHKWHRRECFRVGVDKQCSHQVRRYRLGWVLALFGTDMGAGILLLPLQVLIGERRSHSEELIIQRVRQLLRSHFQLLLIQRHRRTAQRRLQPQASMAKMRRLIRGHRDIGWVENRDVIERREEGGGGIPHIITHTTSTNAEAISGTGDITDQPMLVAALDA